MLIPEILRITRDTNIVSITSSDDLDEIFINYVSVWNKIFHWSYDGDTYVKRITLNTSLCSINLDKVVHVIQEFGAKLTCLLLT